MSPALQSLIALQRLDTAADTARRRLAELPVAEREIDTKIATATEAVEAAKSRQQDNQAARRALEKDVALVDTRLARFDEHKAAVKTNQEYTALLHEITGAKAEKNTIEDQILDLLEAADQLKASVTEAEKTLVEVTRAGQQARQALTAERGVLEEHLNRLAGERRGETAGIQPSLLAKYDQLLKQRRSIAVAAMRGETCTACHVRLRPAFAQIIRRNAEILQCDSCQRILYFVPDPAAAEPTAAGTGS